MLNKQQPLERALASKLEAAKLVEGVLGVKRKARQFVHCKIGYDLAGFRLRDGVHQPFANRVEVALDRIELADQHRRHHARAGARHKPHRGLHGLGRAHETEIGVAAGSLEESASKLLEALLNQRLSVGAPDPRLHEQQEGAHANGRAAFLSHLGRLAAIHGLNINGNARRTVLRATFVILQIRNPNWDIESFNRVGFEANGHRGKGLSSCNLQCPPGRSARQFPYRGTYCSGFAPAFALKMHRLCYLLLAVPQRTSILLEMGEHLSET